MGTRSERRLERDDVGRAGWGILGTGKIARIFAADLRSSRTSRLVAVGSRDSARAMTFATEFGAERSYADYESVLADRDVTFVYIATPHTTHADLAIAAARAGKHVLCEKPLSSDAWSARRMAAAAAAANRLLMEGFAFRCHPQTHRLVELVRGGEIGEPRSVWATFGYDAGPAPTNYLLRHDLAGGSILDVGCYTVALARQLAGSAIGATFSDPTVVQGVGLIDEDHRVDLDAAAVMSFEGGFTAQLACSIRTNLPSTVEVIGTNGVLRVSAPWLPGKHGGDPTIAIQRARGDSENISTDVGRSLYAIEADTVVERAESGRLEVAEMTWDDSIGNMTTLDRWRHAIGLWFDGEEASPSRRYEATA